MKEILFIVLIVSFSSFAGAPQFDELDLVTTNKKFDGQKAWIRRNTLFHLGGIINETSGAVYDREQDVIWSVGDSGPRVLGRTDLKTKKTEVIPIVGHEIARDREELVMDKNGYLWILSVGDNHKRRKSVEINQVDPREYYTNKKLTVLKTMTITYPYGAIDVEGAFIHNDKLYLIQKTFFRKAWIYTVDISEDAPLTQEAVSFKSIKRRSLAKLITAACINDQEEVYVQTYWGTYQLRNWQTANYISPRRIKFDPFVAQAETLVCFEDKLIVARETGRFWWLR